MAGERIRSVVIRTASIGRRLIELPSRPPISKRLQQTHPLDEVRLAIETRQRGIKECDPGLVWPASRQLVIAMANAVINNAVPDIVTEQVAKEVLDQNIAHPGISVVRGMPTDPDRAIPPAQPGISDARYADIISPTIATATQTLALTAEHASSLITTQRDEMMTLASGIHWAMHHGHFSSPT